MKNNKTIIIIILILVVGLAFGVVNAVFSLSSVILPEKEGIPVGDFGGVLLKGSTFDAGITDVKSTSVNATVDHSQYNGGSMSVSSVSIGSEYHANLFTSCDLTKYDYMMIDFDLDIVSLSDTLGIGAVHRNESEKLVGAVPNCSQYLYLTPNGNDYDFFILNYGVHNKVATTDKGSVHLTFIYRYDRFDWDGSNALVYLNGIYIGSIDGFIRAEAARASSLRFHQIEDSNTTAPDLFYVDNYSCYGFESGYTGAINYLFDNTDYTLFECSDSVLFDN